MGDGMQEIKLITYGYVAFAVLPITICLFGLKELNGVYCIVADSLNEKERCALDKIITEKTNWTVVLGFLIVIVQVVFAFCLSFFQEYKNIFFGIWGALLGASVAILIYGLAVCLSIKEVYNFINQQKNRAIKAKQQKDFKHSLEDGFNFRQNNEK